jgi:hypothetical protein
MYQKEAKPHYLENEHAENQSNIAPFGEQI